MARIAVYARVSTSGQTVENQVRELCYKARELLIEEGNVVGVDAPVTVRNPGTCSCSPAEHAR